MDNNPLETSGQATTRLKPILELLDMIKFEHTIFALPFAFIGALAATGARIPWLKFFWILVAMVGARTLAMAFNRMADADLDAENPRTADRAIPKGRVKPWQAWLLIGLSAVVFGLAAVALGPLPAKLAPYALFVLLGYSYAKRFTVWSHAILGLALSLAPTGAWIAVSGRLEAPALWLSLGVLSWTAGFDIIYALQDLEFDKKKGLYSIPVELGVAAALKVSRGCHILAVFSWAVFMWDMNVAPFTWLSLLIVTLILFREQMLVRRGNLDNIDHAFFTLNSFVGPILFFGYLLHWIALRDTI